MKVREKVIVNIKAVAARAVGAVSMSAEEIDQYKEDMQREAVEKNRKQLISHMRRYYCVNQRIASHDRSKLRLKMADCEADRALTWDPVLEGYHQKVGDFGTKWIRDN